MWSQLVDLWVRSVRDPALHEPSVEGGIHRQGGQSGKMGTFKWGDGGKKDGFTLPKTSMDTQSDGLEKGLVYET